MNNDKKIELIALVQGLKKGDEKCLQKLFYLFQNQLYSFCYYLSKNPALADEITQETFIKASKEIHRLEKESSFKQWLFSIARQLYIRHRRPQKNKDHDSLEKVQEQSTNSNEVEYRNLVNAALASLDEQERQALLLVVVGDHSYEEAAEILGIKFNLLHTQLKSAKKKFIEYCTEKNIELTGLFMIPDKKVGG